MLKLYITPGSPYARMARIVVLEKGLESRVETIPARTREAGSPYYAINPSGRVPYLVCEDGRAFEDSAVVCAWLDHLDGRPRFDLPQGEHKWEARRLEAMARNMLDGLSVWLRELHRPPNERSPGIIEHEKQRAARTADVWEREIGHPLLAGEIDFIQITLACALGLERRIAAKAFDWRTGHPALVAWYECIAARPSLVATAPPEL